jgi:hypothetical protein
VASLEASRYLCEGTQEAIKICQDVRFFGVPHLNLGNPEHEKSPIL